MDKYWEIWKSEGSLVLMSYWLSSKIVFKILLEMEKNVFFELFAKKMTFLEVLKIFSNENHEIPTNK